MSRNHDIRKILESREIAHQQQEEQKRIQEERNRRRGCQPGLDPDNLFVRNSLFPWSAT